MIYELITNSPHRNSIALYKCYDEEKTYYKKVSLTQRSNKLIENEKRGYSWFLNGVEENSQVRLIKDYFYELDIPEFEGRNFPPNNKISGNEPYIEMIIDYYKRKWASADEFTIHGDLALCNVIITSTGDMRVVDWEHFHYADRACFGFDIVNMLFISLYCQFRRVFFINRLTRRFLRRCYKQLIDGAGSVSWILKKPFQNAGEYMKRFPDRFNMNIAIEEKFVLARYPQQELAKLDAITTRD
jgi:hypothetical protein